MNKKIELKLSRLESTQIALLKLLDTVDAQKLNTPPAPNKWSVAQVIYHLNQAESQSVIYVGKKMQDVNNLKTTGLIEQLKIWIVQLAFVSPIKFKAPAILGEVPKDVDYTAIKQKWEDTRRRLRELIERLPDEMLDKNVFKQPAAGRLNIYQMVDFMQAHFNRHLRQIKAIVG